MVDNFVPGFYDCIIADILVGIDQARAQTFVIPDRREAIFKAVSLCEPGDIVFILGKGD